MMTLFEEGELLHSRALSCMAGNEVAALNASAVYPNAPWINHPTLVRWLYGSSQAFVKEYDGFVKKNFPTGLGEQTPIMQWQNELNARLGSFRTQLSKLYHDNEEIMGALR